MRLLSDVALFNKVIHSNICATQTGAFWFYINKRFSENLKKCLLSAYINSLKSFFCQQQMSTNSLRVLE